MMPCVPAHAIAVLGILDRTESKLAGLLGSGQDRPANAADNAALRG
jgi:hypothetical protein